MSVLGLGMAKLPIDEHEAAMVLRAALENGVNFLDFSGVEASGREEEVCRLAGSVMRETACGKVYLTVALSPVRHEASFNLDAYLGKRAEWLGVDNVDALNMAGLNSDTWPSLKDSGLLTQADRCLADGNIGALGFTFYDQALYLRPVLNECDGWSFSRFQASFMDADRLPGAAGLISSAAHKGLAVVAVDPLLGGRLGSNLPKSITDLWEQLSPRTSAEWALRWVWNQPKVSTAVVDMVSPEQVTGYVVIAGATEPDSLTIAEEVIINRVRDAYRKLRPVPCTTCRACLPCARGIDAPRIFELYNDAVMYGNREIPLILYRNEGYNIDDCDGCAVCSRACGRGIDIPAVIKEAHRFLMMKNGSDTQ